MHGQQNDKYTEMHGQQNDKYTEMQGQQNDKYTEMHGQQNVKKMYECSSKYLHISLILTFSVHYPENGLFWIVFSVNFLA